MLIYYDCFLSKISLVVDLHDQAKWQDSRNYYRGKNRLTPENKLQSSPPLSLRKVVLSTTWGRYS